MNQTLRQQVFDYRMLRGLVGAIAFLLPIVVSLVSGKSLSSISAYYYTESQDYFVGMLCIVGAFLAAYNGHNSTQSFWSKVAAVAAFGVAFFPTTCDSCEPGFTSYVHIISAATLFLILAYFCHVFYSAAVEKEKEGAKNRRKYIYALCGLVIAVSLLAALIDEFFLTGDGLKKARITFYAEWSALGAFGIAWTIAGIYQVRLEMPTWMSFSK